MSHLFRIPFMSMNKSIEQEKEAKPILTHESYRGQITAKIIDFAKMVKKVGKDDPRRIVHSMKVGLALTLVSLFYYFRPLYDGFGPAGMWAVLTVVVVFEFTVGGTLSKCLNRGFATLIAGALGVGAEALADLGGKDGEPIMLGVFVFVLAAICTFLRFFPYIKRRYDYGVLIFILTFSLVAVSGYRVEEILQLAHQRLSTILIGAATCMLISIVCFPVWAGQDLHNTVASNIEKLGAFLEGFGNEFYNDIQVGDKSFLESYKSVLNSKATEESLANFAWWEPGHGRFRFNHPWKQYLKIGTLARECACQIETLDRLIKTKSKVSLDLPFSKIQQECTTLSTSLGKALKELASSMKTMTFPSPATETQLEKSKAASEEVKKILESFALPVKSDLQEFFPILVSASVLIDNIKCVENISVSIHELSQKARFKNPKSAEELKQQQLMRRGTVKPVDTADVNDPVVIEICGISPDTCSHSTGKQPK